jgi:anti-sigma-K factor RskA
MNPNDDARLDDAAALALGALSDSEAKATAARLSQDVESAREYAELRPVADLLGFSAETADSAPSELQSARMKNNLLRQIRAEAAPAPAVPFASARPPRQPWLAYLAAAACLAVAFLATFNLSNVRTANDANQQQIALLRAQLDAQTHAADTARARLALTQSQLADLISPGSERYPVQGGVVERAAGRILIALQHLPAPPKGKVYQAWTLHKGAKAVAPSITFVPDATGLVLIELPGPGTDIAAVAVSVEPAGGSKAPTSTPKFIRPLS